MKLKQTQRKASVAIAGIAMTLASVSAHADLNATLQSGQTFLQTIGRTMDVLAAITGAYFILSGIMTWKKSSSEHGGQTDFKSVAIPIVTGGLLVAFSALIGATSTTFGFASTYAY